MIARIRVLLQRQSALFASLMLFLLAAPIAVTLGPDAPIWIVYATLALVFVTGPLAVARNRVELAFTAVLAAATLVPLVIESFVETRDLGVSSGVLGVLFFGFLITLEARTLLFERRRVDAETLWGAVNVYILMAMLFSSVYRTLEWLLPGSFLGSAGTIPPDQAMFGFYYFSFVTITTLGYGDITPANAIAGTLAYLEALLGQLYVAVMIARLVGLYAKGPTDEAPR